MQRDLTKRYMQRMINGIKTRAQSKGPQENSMFSLQSVASQTYGEIVAELKCAKLNWCLSFCHGAGLVAFAVGVALLFGLLAVICCPRLSLPKHSVSNCSSVYVVRVVRLSSYASQTSSSKTRND
eukprot:4538084-Amphidinium_carterae.1